MTVTGLSVPPTLFGISRGLDASELRELVDFLRDAWRAQYAQDPSTLSADLDRLADVFRSHASPKRLRAAASALRPARGRPVHLPRQVYVPVDDQRGFVTPEGRVLLEHLSDLADRDQVLL